jgi:hypothetical protein
MLIATVTHTAAHTSQFWPTVSRVGTAIAAIAGTFAAGYSNYNAKRINSVHMLVNGGLDQKVTRMEAAAAKVEHAAETIDPTATEIVTPTPALVTTDGHN